MLISSRLNELLDEAITLSAQFRGGGSHQFLNAESFHIALRDAVSALRTVDESQLKNPWLWFAPTCDWDDLIGAEGALPAREIHDLVTSILKSGHN